MVILVPDSVQVAKLMADLWTAFAQHADPNGPLGRNGYPSRLVLGWVGQLLVHGGGAFSLFTTLSSII